MSVNVNSHLSTTKWLSWLVCQSSLTKRLKERAGEAVLTLLSQDWQLPTPWSRDELGLPDHPVLCREIVMVANGEPCWYARSIYPENTYRSHPWFFEKLKQGTLNSILYHHPAIQRASLKYYSIDQPVELFQWLPDQLKQSIDQPIWIRQSQFLINQTDPFYLIEFLLPALERYCD